MAKIVQVTDDGYVIRPWGGKMCFAGKDKTGAERIVDSAALLMATGLRHSVHSHEDVDELLYVLEGNGVHKFFDDAGNEVAHDIHPGDFMYIAKNRVHHTNNFDSNQSLKLLVCNYKPEKQPRLDVKGIVRENEGKKETTEFGYVTEKITEDICGTDEFFGELLTINAGATYVSAAVADEELIFVMDGELELVENGESPKLNAETFAFFKAPEQYSLKNNGSKPVKVFRYYTK